MNTLRHKIEYRVFFRHAKAGKWNDTEENYKTRKAALKYARRDCMIHLDGDYCVVSVTTRKIKSAIFKKPTFRDLFPKTWRKRLSRKAIQLCQILSLWDYEHLERTVEDTELLKDMVADGVSLDHINELKSLRAVLAK